MGAMKELLGHIEADERSECEDCGELCEVVEMGRRWCRKCWEVFANEYEMFLLMEEMENQNEPEA